MKNKILKKLSELKNSHILVIGDIILDHYLTGKCSRLSPEAPVPVVEIKDETFLLGGAANVANNIVSIGATCYLCGVIGTDNQGESLLKLLKEKQIKTELIVKDDSRPTTIKTRVLGNNHQIVRIDNEKTDNLSDKVQKELLDKIFSAFGYIDGIIIEDYGKGLLNKESIELILCTCKEKGIKVFIDPKKEYSFTSGYVVKPNLKEAMDFTGIKDDIEKIGKRLLLLTCAENILLTLSENGMILFNKKETITIPTYANEVCDVSGAGDTVIAIFTLAKLCGYTLKQSMILANIAAGIVIKKLGCATTNIEEIKETLKINDKI